MSVALRSSGALGGTAATAFRSVFVGMKTRFVGIVATPAGFEPATPSLEGWCSIRLSYGVLPGARFTRAAGLLKGARLGNLHGPEALAISAIADDADRARQGLGALWASKAIEKAMPMPRLPGFS